jgi:plasmid stabilization system protein ParE
MSRLAFTPLAEADLNEILDYIAGHRPLTAVAAMTRIREKCDLLASHPLTRIIHKGRIKAASGGV